MSSSSHNVYLIISKKRGLYKTYVGYAKNIRKRIQAHNSNKGAKSTRGRDWKLVYKREFIWSTINALGSRPLSMALIIPWGTEIGSSFLSLL